MVDWLIRDSLLRQLVDSFIRLKPVNPTDSYYNSPYADRRKTTKWLNPDNPMCNMGNINEVYCNHEVVEPTKVHNIRTFSSITSWL
jgi:hypothetical protein